MIPVAAFYRFAALPDPGSLVAPLLALGRSQGVKGSLILAPEGVNGTIAGAGLDRMLDHIAGWPGFAGIVPRFSQAAAMPFGRLKVKVKPEIVTMGAPGLDPAATGTLVAPQDWDRLIADPMVTVIDCRNAYEIAVGTFPGAIDPGTASFSDFPAWWRAQSFGDRPVAMFCTGGIRCEKATAFLRAGGVEQVYHLQGGILNYLETVPDGSWQGQCFVFDDRVSVGPGLVPGDLSVCGACRRPVRPEDRSHPAYETGVACPACAGEYSPADRARFRERHRQMTLARARGARHLGP
jgi:UPF0176 protein